MLQQSSLRIIKLGRRWLGHTAVNEWALTGWVKTKVFKAAFRQPEQQVEYLGAKLVVPTADTSIAPGLLGQYYEKTEIELFRSLSAISRTIMDVGANLGDYACVGGLVLPDGSRIFSFEPVTNNLTYLRRNVALNHLENKVTIVEAAVGDTDGDLKIYLSKTNGGNHSASAQTAKSAGDYQTVPQVALDTYVKDHQLTDVDILKVDVEGFDGHVLRGAKQLLATQHPTLFVEYIPKLLKNCDFDPQEFIGLITDNYQHCYFVHEEKGYVSALSPDELVALAKKTSSADLIVTNNPKHIQVLNQNARQKP
jgi:FkbM family methyltransferase